MFRTVSLMSLALLFVMLSYPNQSRADDKLFLANKCNKCHTISALGIKKLGDEAASEEKSASGPPDLSNVGKFHDVAFITSFLKKEIDHAPHDGRTDTKKHMKKWDGSDADLTTIATWLTSQKADPK